MSQFHKDLGLCIIDEQGFWIVPKVEKLRFLKYVLKTIQFYIANRGGYVLKNLQSENTKTTSISLNQDNSLFAVFDNF